MLITEDLIARIEASEALRLVECARSTGHDSLSLSVGAAAFCGEGNPMTQCSGVGSGGPFGPEDFDRILHFYCGRCESFEFKLSPISPSILRTRVIERAKSIPEFETILVQALSAMSPMEVLADIREVTSESALGYSQRTAARFCEGTAPPAGLVEVIAGSCVGPNVRTFEGYEDGQPVSGCSMSFAEGVAWFAGAAVDPAQRGKGWHKTLQAFRIRLAKRHGCDLVCQGALPGSISQQNAQKSGFSIAFTRPTIMVDPG